MPKKDVRLAKSREALRQEKLYREALHLGLEPIANSPRLHNGVRAAFKDFGLDPKNSLHTKILLGILANVCFPGLSHKKTRWDDYYYVVLARCFEVISRKHEGVSDRQAAKLIRQEFSRFQPPHRRCASTAITRGAQALPTSKNRNGQANPWIGPVGKFSGPSILANNLGSLVHYCRRCVDADSCRP
jgi:hypothetical protein